MSFTVKSICLYMYISVYDSYLMYLVTDPMSVWCLITWTQTLRWVVMFSVLEFQWKPLY